VAESAKPDQNDANRSSAKRNMAEKDQQTRPETPTLLVVDDDERFLEDFPAQIADLGYAIQSSTSYDDVAVRITESACDALLLGVNVANPDVIEHVAHIKSHRLLRETPLVVVSDDREDRIKIQALSFGANEYIQKPVNLAEVSMRLMNLLELHEYRRRLHEENALLSRQKTLLSRYFSEDLIDRILQEDRTALESANLTASLLFFDLRNSTGIGESVTPQQFSTFLSDVLTDVMDLVFGNGGSVNKMLGDGLFATFGCPIPGPDDAGNAVRCAVQIRDYLSTYNDVRPDFIQAPIGAALGVSTGRVFAGNIGSVRRLEYAVIGDAVNLASRLENLAKHVQSDDPAVILIDGATHDVLGERIRAQKLRIERVRGKTEQVRIYLLKSLLD